MQIQMIDDPCQSLLKLPEVVASFWTETVKHGASVGGIVLRSFVSTTSILFLYVLLNSASFSFIGGLIGAKFWV